MKPKKMSVLSIAQKMQYIALYIFSFGLAGVVSFITGTIGFELIKDPAWWANNILTYTSIILVIAATMLQQKDTFVQSNEEYQTYAKNILDFAQKTYIPSIFGRFLEKINYTRKVTQHKYNVIAQLHKLETSLKEKDKVTVFQLWNSSDEKAKQQDDYCRTRMMLERQLEEDWIKSNINSVAIKYDVLTSCIILGGFAPSSNKGQANEFVTKHKTTKVAVAQLPRLLYSLMLTTFLSSLILDFVVSATAWINIITKVFTLCWNIFLTIRYADTYNTTVTLKDIRFRNGIVEEYYLWTKTQTELSAKEIEQQKIPEIKVVQETIENPKPIPVEIFEKAKQLLLPKTPEQEELNGQSK